MMQSKRILAVFLSIIFIFPQGCVKKEKVTGDSPSKYVNPFIGTGGWVEAYPGEKTTYDEIRKNPGRYAFGGLTFPGATAPFGMIQLSPDCQTKGFGWSAGYHYSDYSILGFSHNHTSGNGMGFGHFLLMPGTGPVHFEPGDYNKSDGYRSRFSHVSEKARPGYYSVYLDDYDVKVELTATERVGIHRYTFREKQAGHILFDLKHALGNYQNPIETGFRIESKNAVSAYRITENGIKAYCYLEFSRPFSSRLTNDGKENATDAVKGPSIQVAFIFDNAGDEPVTVKAAVSFTSLENAKANMAYESPGWDFDKIAAQTLEKWNNELSKITVQTDDSNIKTMFYTALYHSTLTPFLFGDVTGDFLGADGKIHRIPGFTDYTFFTLWDTYRSLHPLLTIIHPERVNDLINSMLAQADFSSNKLLPLWCLAGQNGYNMAGYSAAPVITEAIAKGFDGFDKKKAVDYMIANAMTGGFSGHESYLKKGYVPADETNMSVPKTLEYAFCDGNIALAAKLTGDTIREKEFMKTSANYANVFDKSTGFMRGRLADGSWRTPFDPKEVSHQFPDNDFMESNSWQYTFHVMHDVPGLIELMGGKQQFVQKLDSLFDQPSYLTGIYAADVSGLVGQYAQGNQPSQHVAYLYVYAGQPWKTQYRVRQVIERTYADNPDGLPGNDDGGQTSSWLVFSMLGFYPVYPASGIYIIGSPTIDKAEIHVRDKKFTIIAHNNSDKNIYIRSARLNGKEYKRAWIRHQDIVNGSILELEMGDTPDKTWGSAMSDLPPLSYE